MSNINDFKIENGVLVKYLGADGKVVLENVRVCGRMLAGYDFCFEHSGNGVAISSAYKAARE